MTVTSAQSASAVDRSCWELFNPFDAEFPAEPYRHYRRLRETAPLYFHSGMSAWLASRHQDITEILNGPGFGRAGQLDSADPFGSGSSPGQFTGQWMIGLDAPQHTRVRRCFARAFSPRLVQGLRPVIESLAASLLDRLAEDGGGDFIGMVAGPLPFAVICHLLGIPEPDWPVLLSVSANLLPLMEPVLSDDDRRAVEEAARQGIEYYDELIGKRRRHPGDDLLSHIIAVSDERQRTEADGLTAAELMNNIAFLFSAAHETTTSVLGTGLHALLTQPGQLGRLRADPGLLGPAVMEMIRWEAPFQFIAQRARAATVVTGGTEIAEGEVVITLLGAGNHDPERFTDPETFDVGRADGLPLSFGVGMHYCIGAGLAKMEAEILFSQLIARFGQLRIEGEPVRRPGFSFRAFDTLSVGV
jgi:cytochrome P450